MLRVNLTSRLVQNFEVEVRAGRGSGASHFSNNLTGLNLRAHLNIAAIQVAVSSFGAVGVLDFNPFTVARGLVFRDCDASGFGRSDRCVQGSGQVDTFVVAAGTGSG